MFLAFVREEQLFTKKERVLLAVSGGKDSIFMTQLFAQSGHHFGIAHCNFQLRGEESNQDAVFVEDVARSLAVPFFKVNFDTTKVAEDRRISIQMAARDLRYQWLEEVRAAEGYDHIAVAHHQTDSTETVLLNLVRGTGIAGLHGILPKRDTLVRPLLGFTGVEISQYIQDNQVAYREDRSNKETKYARNKIRLEVLPVLKKINPVLDTIFYKSSKRFLALEEFLNRQIEGIRKELFVEKEQGVFYCQIVQLNCYAEDSFVLYEVFKPFRFSETVIHDFMASLADPHSGNLFYSDTHQLLIDREGIVIRAIQTAEIPPVFIEQLPMEFKWGDGTYSASLSTDVAVEKICGSGKESRKVKIDATGVLFPIEIRSWHKGDSFRPLGLRGTKKVSDFLIDQKIPLDKKRRIPLFVNANQEILSIATWRIDDRYKIISETKKVIIFEQL